MRFIVKSGPGTVEVAYMWLPTFLGLNTVMMGQIEEKLAPVFVGQELTDDVLNEAHERFIEIVCELHPLPGLRDYLDAVKFVEG